jgi:hypothetical protein
MIGSNYLHWIMCTDIHIRRKTFSTSYKFMHFSSFISKTCTKNNFFSHQVSITCFNWHNSLTFEFITHLLQTMLYFKVIKLKYESHYLWGISIEQITIFIRSFSFKNVCAFSLIIHHLCNHITELWTKIHLIGTCGWLKKYRKAKDSWCTAVLTG